MPRECEKENHPEQGLCSALLQSLPCEGNSCGSFPGTHSPGCRSTRGTARRAEIAACDVTALLLNSRSHLVPGAPRCPPGLWGSATKLALSHATWPKSPEVRRDKDKTSLKRQLGNTRHSRRSTCDSENPVHV